VLRLRDTVTRSLHEFFHSNDFVYVHTPIITSNDSEGAGESFRLAPVPSRLADRGVTADNTEFFNKPSYLTVSSQLHLEALSNAVARVWTLSPCFRAERSQTSRHLAEFWMLEAEWSFVRSIDDLCDVAEASIKHVLRHQSPDRDLLQASTGASWTATGAAASETPWARISYTDAIHELQKCGARLSSHLSGAQHYRASMSVGLPIHLLMVPSSSRITPRPSNRFTCARMMTARRSHASIYLCLVLASWRGGPSAKSGRLCSRLPSDDRDWTTRLIGGTPNCANLAVHHMVDMEWVLNDLSVG